MKHPASHMHNISQVDTNGRAFLPTKSRALIIEAFLPGRAMSLRVKIGARVLFHSPLREICGGLRLIQVHDGFLPCPITDADIIVVAFEVLEIKGTVLRDSALL